jgi:hypothetical protein
MNGIEDATPPMTGERSGSLVNNTNYATPQRSFLQHNSSQSNSSAHYNSQPGFTMEHPHFQYNSNLAYSPFGASPAYPTPPGHFPPTDPFNRIVSNSTQWQHSNYPMHYAPVPYPGHSVGINNYNGAYTVHPFNNGYYPGNTFNNGFGIHQCSPSYGLNWCPCCLPPRSSYQTGPMRNQPVPINFGTYQYFVPPPPPPPTISASIPPPPPPPPRPVAHSTSLQMVLPPPPPPRSKKRSQTVSNMSIYHQLSSVPDENMSSCASLRRTAKRKKSNPFGLPDDSDDVICYVISFCNFRTAIAIASTNKRFKELVHCAGLMFKEQLSLPMIIKDGPSIGYGFSSQDHWTVRLQIGWSREYYSVNDFVPIAVASLEDILELALYDNMSLNSLIDTLKNWGDNEFSSNHPSWTFGANLHQVKLDDFDCQHGYSNVCRNFVRFLQLGRVDSVLHSLWSALQTARGTVRCGTFSLEAREQFGSSVTVAMLQLETIDNKKYEIIGQRVK